MCEHSRKFAVQRVLGPTPGSLERRPRAAEPPPACRFAARAKPLLVPSPTVSVPPSDVTARNGNGGSPSRHSVSPSSTTTVKRQRKRMTSPDQERWLTSEGTTPRRSRRGYFPELVCAHGPRADRRRHRAPVGADALPQELDPVALHRPRAGLLAGRAAGDPEDRRQRAQRGDPHRAAQGQAAGARRAAPRSAQRCGSTSASCAPPTRRSPPDTTRSAARRSICG